MEPEWWYSPGRVHKCVKFAGNDKHTSLHYDRTNERSKLINGAITRISRLIRLLITNGLWCKHYGKLECFSFSNISRLWVFFCVCTNKVRGSFAAEPFTAGTFHRRGRFVAKCNFQHKNACSPPGLVSDGLFGLSTFQPFFRPFIVSPGCDNVW